MLQILEITDKAVLCLKLIDEAKRHNISIDIRIRSKDLGIPVVETSARYGKGIPELLATIHKVASGEIICNPHHIKSISKQLEKTVNKLVRQLEEEYPGLTNSRWIAFRLLEGDKKIIEAIRNDELSIIKSQKNGEVLEVANIV